MIAMMGGTTLPKVMGTIADSTGLSRAFIVRMACFGFIAAYAFLWPRLSGAQGLHGVSASGGH